MSSGTNSYAFCADYSDMASCLFAIQAMEDSGGFDDHTVIPILLAMFDGGVLKQLYNKAIQVLGVLDGFITLPDHLQGDFEYVDFSALDFNAGIIDGRNTSYSSHFQTILNIFGILCSRSSELSDADIQSLNTTLIWVLDAFAAIRNDLIQLGLNPCLAVPAYFNNSSSLYLQAAGSDGANGIAEGIHLRWSLAGDLGSNHLPQGDYYADSSNPTGYNQTHDYVVLSRTPYVNEVQFTVDFENALPAIDYSAFRWTYTLNRVSGGKTVSNLCRLSFKDIALYKQLAVILNPQANPFNFLKQYNGLLEMQIDQKNAFAIGYDFRLNTASDTGILKIQAICASEINGVLGETENIRETVTAVSADPVTGTIFGDNILKIQLQKSGGGFLQSFSFETYDDFVSTRESSDWTVVGSDFALSLTDQTVFDRLETSAYPVDDLWPQYNDGTRVRVANYQDKWLTSHANDQSIKLAVERYLLLSETDPQATDVVKDDDAPADAAGLTISYLSVLNMMALDYHWARMFGLGHIDTQVNVLDPVQFIYKISYTNRQSPGSQETVNHEYLSLPTGRSDSRLPEKPLMRPLTYTSTGLTGTTFDENGYANYADIRLINIGRQPYNFEQENASLFFADTSASGDFNIFDHATSILYGIEYRRSDQTSYQKPEITNDQTLGFNYYAYDADFPETGVLETVPVPDNPISLYTHLEKQPGIHAYAIYGVNWFARASEHSEESETDETLFPINNKLLPPTGLTVQYIQKEDPLIFTTATEQNWLNERNAQFPGQDTSFTRLTFNWLDITDISYVQDLAEFDFSTVIKPTRVKAWFKSTPLLQLTGVIIQILNVSGQESMLMLLTGNYTLLDGSPAGSPVTGTDLLRFVGSPLSTAEGQFTVNSVMDHINGPIFIIEKVRQVITVSDESTPGRYSTRNTYILPGVGSRFTVTENLTQQNSWEPVTEDIQLIDYGHADAPVTEYAIDEYGNVTRFLIGGISGNAVILQLTTATEDHAIMPGYYSVTYSPEVILAPHPQTNLPFDPDFPDANSPGTLQAPYVQWYNGQIRIPLAGRADEKKLVNVIRIVQTSPLVLYVYDAAYQNNTIRISATPADLIDQVNFHPGYKAYLYPEPPPDHAFNGANILSGSDPQNNKTMLGLQAADIGSGRSGFLSLISPPAILLALKTIAPVQPPVPIIYGLKVRPDATAKAAFTFDTKITSDASDAARTPFGFMFYRTTNEDVLEALYAPDTIVTILGQLDDLTTDDHFNQRYVELVNLIFDPDNAGHFKVFDASPQPYGFPAPDRAGLTEDSDTLAVKTAKYQGAIITTLLPLTAQTPIFSLIKPGTQTDNKLPTIRTVDGNLIDAADPAFDPFPMIRRYPAQDEPNTSYVRFTDYTLNGSSRFLYFYSSAEVSSKLVIGELSPFAGPVSILHTIPADAPIVRYFTLGAPATAGTSPLAVTFFISPFSPEDTIGKVRIYRATEQKNALALRSMESYVDRDVVMDPQNGIVVTDDFSDLTLIPFGSLIYYRLVFIRSMINERDETEEVVGLGSDVITVNLIDTVNPAAPALTYIGADNKLTWLPTTNKGTYYLYTQNNRGNWQNIYQVSPASSTDVIEHVLTDPLVLTDADGNRIYYRFKVKVENSSGLLNLTDNELTI